jgi:Transglutaminase-like superfamily
MPSRIIAILPMLAAVSIGLGTLASSSVRAADSPSGTLLLGGSMSSTDTMVLTGALSVGHLANLDWNLPLPKSLAISGYQERVLYVSYSFSVKPNSAQDETLAGQTIRRFHWNAPPADTVIRVRERMKVTITTKLSRFRSRAAYPLVSVASDLTQYLAVTPMTRLFRRGHALAKRLARGHRSERGVVVAVADYVATHIKYDPTRLNGPHTASWVLKHHVATCQGFANAMAALLRTLGIPSQIESGWVTSTPVWVPGPEGMTSWVQWSTAGTSGASHAWLNVYFPDRGWVPFDPQKEKFFIDPRHIGFYAGLDSGSRSTPVWTAQLVNASLDSTGRILNNGSTVIVPGEFGSKVTLVSRDNSHVTIRQVRRDVTGILLFAR